MMGDDENPLEGGKTGTLDPKRAFNLKPLAVRFLIVFAGPAMNFVLAVVIFSLVFMILGRPVAPTLIGRVVEGGPVAQAGLKTGDRITAIDGRPVQYWEDVQRAAQNSQEGCSRSRCRARPASARSRVTPALTKTRDLFGDERQTWDLGRGPTCHRRSAISSRGFPPRKRDSSGATSSLRSREARAVLGRAGRSDPAAPRPADPPRGQAGAETLAVTVVPNAVKERGPDGKEIEVGRIGISPAAGFSFVRSNPIQAVREGSIARSR